MPLSFFDRFRKPVALSAPLSTPEHLDFGRDVFGPIESQLAAWSEQKEIVDEYTPRYTHHFAATEVRAAYVRATRVATDLRPKLEKSGYSIPVPRSEPPYECL